MVMLENINYDDSSNLNHNIRIESSYCQGKKYSQKPRGTAMFS